jgi:hypothetical protein
MPHKNELKTSQDKNDFFQKLLKNPKGYKEDKKTIIHNFLATENVTPHKSAKDQHFILFKKNKKKNLAENESFFHLLLTSLHLKKNK